MHRKLGPFDWIEALRILAASGDRFGYETLAVTDRELPVPHLAFDTREPHLMLWILEVSLAYIESEHFDQDTIWLSPDSIINAPLPGFGGFDLGVTVRLSSKYRERPLLNSLQWWPVASKAKLAAFFRRCLEDARGLSKSCRIWGADTIPLVRALRPMAEGILPRAGMRVRMFSHHLTLQTITTKQVRMIARGERPGPGGPPVIDFKCQRKVHMADYWRLLDEAG